MIAWPEPEVNRYLRIIIIIIDGQPFFFTLKLFRSKTRAR